MIYMRGQVRRLRPLAAARPCRLGLGRCEAAVPQAATITFSAPASITASAANGASNIRALRWDITRRLRDAAAQAGIPKIDDFNTGDNEGCGYFHVNQKTRTALVVGARLS